MLIKLIKMINSKIHRAMISIVNSHYLNFGYVSLNIPRRYIVQVRLE